MENMDLWNMFSTNFVEGDATSINDKFPDNGEQANNGDHVDVGRHRVKQEIIEDNERGEDLVNEENEENHNDDEDMLVESNRDNQQTQNNETVRRNSRWGGSEADDDVIFNFDLRPVNTGGDQFNRTIGSRVPPSQINPTDRLGRPINYELGVIYICPACGKEFPAQDKWKAHMNTKHQYNTRQGLNFVRVDKLYHRCLECRKNIAMHSMENLLKHKFTHLPHRCVKCAVCLRQYKYRQDLMVHLRMQHSEDVIELMKGNGIIRQSSSKYYPSSRSLPSSYSGDGGGGSSNKKDAGVGGGGRLAIMNVKENAVDMFDADESIEVRNEPEMDDDDYGTMDNFNIRAMFDDDVSRSSSHSAAANGKRARDNGTNSLADASSSFTNAASSGRPGSKEEVCEDYIHYICPQCGTECDTHAHWNQHIEFVHDFTSERGLNFKSISGQKSQCLDCNRIVEPNNIKVLQLHKFLHSPHNEWMRCKLCYKGFKYRKSIQSHLLQQHHLESIIDDNSQPSDNDNSNFGDVNGGGDDQDDSAISSGRIRNDENFEAHIDYLCPHCGKEFFERKLWRNHVMQLHQMNDINTLNFKVINDRQLMCNECGKIITNAYGIQNAQQHRITHLPHKAFARCRICRKTYTDRKGLVKHIITRHRIGFGGDYQPSIGGSGRSKPKEAKRESSSSSAVVKVLAVEPRKQIVTVKDEIYEIIYLEEDDGDFIASVANATGGPAHDLYDTIDDSALFDDSAFGGNDGYDSISRSRNASAISTAPTPSKFKCGDCGSLFSTQNALAHHIRNEHEFQEFNSPKPTQQQKQQKQKQDKPDSGLALQQQTNTKDNDDGSKVAEKNFIFLCPKCGTEYATQFDWRRHINEAHNFDKRHFLNMRQIDKFRYKCTVCQDIVCNPKLKGLQDHHFRHLPFRLYLKCLICGTCYNHKPNIVSHLRTRHNIVDPGDLYDYQQNARQSTPTGGAGGDSSLGGSERQVSKRYLENTVPHRPPGLNTIEDNISYHNAVDLDFITYFCPKCNQNFDSHAFWRKHIVEQHNYNSREGLNFRQIDNHHFLCLECYIRVTVTHTKGAIGQLQSHKFRHLPYRSFKCLTCNGEFVRKQMFFKHLNRNTNRCDGNSTVGANDKVQIDKNKHLLETDPEEQIESDNDNDNNDDIENDNENEKANSNDKKTLPSTSLDQQHQIDPNTYKLLCPKCGEAFDTKGTWREHVNIKHEFGKKTSLNLNKISESSYQCRECNEIIITTKLREMQFHCFKHLPYGAYIRCKLCNLTCCDFNELSEHLQQQHPNAINTSDDGEEGDETNGNGDIENDGEDRSQDEDIDNDNDGNVNDEEEEVEEDEEEIENESNSTSSHSFMPPMPPHLLDDDEDMDFDEQYLLG